MTTDPAHPTVPRVRLLARVVLVVPLVVAWFVAVGYAVNEPSADVEGIALFVGLVAITAVAIVAWSRERLGGLVLIGLAAVAGVFAYFTSTPNNVAVGVIVALPWLLSGLLFVAVDWLESRKTD